MKIPWRRKRQPTPVFLPGKSHGQRNLVGYSPWSRKESDVTERLNNNNFYAIVSFLLLSSTWTSVLSVVTSPTSHAENRSKKSFIL